MACYRLAGQEIHISPSVPELEPYEAVEMEPAAEKMPPVPPALALTRQTVGWVGEAWRAVEVWSAPPGTLLKVAGGSAFTITPGGQRIIRVTGERANEPLAAQTNPRLDRQIILGPALVMALALRGVWSLHASAALFRESLLVFLGETGQGKSTLAAYLASSAGWRRVADDILPVEMDGRGLWALPHYPQLKLTPAAQPGAGLPERLPLKTVCVLEPAGEGQQPALDRLTTAQSARVLLRHTAGTRMFEAALLKQHFEFSTRAAGQMVAYHLVYPHNRSTLPLVRELLEEIG